MDKNQQRNQSSSESTNWRLKVNELLETCQGELRRTTSIGKKMFSASKASSELHSAYESLGKLAEKEIRSGALKWDHAHATKLCEKIQRLREDLDLFETEVHQMKSEESGGRESETQG